MTARSIDIQGDDPAFERRTHAVQRAGWWSMLIITLLACAGLFGHGPISRATAQSDDGSASARFERFVRAGAAQTWRCTLPCMGHRVLAHVNRRYLEHMYEVEISPAPAEVRAAAAGDVIYVLACERQGHGAGQEHEMVIEFRGRPRGAGRVPCEVRVQADPADGISAREVGLAFNQFVYP
jgi:hypothetical protein